MKDATDIESFPARLVAKNQKPHTLTAADVIIEEQRVLQQRVQVLEIFSRLVHTLGITLDPEQALQEIANGARSLTDADASAIVLISRKDQKEQLQLVSQSCKDDGEYGPDLLAQATLSSAIIDTGKPQLIRDTLIEPKWKPAGNCVRSLIGVPIRISAEKSGVLYVASAEDNTFGDHDVGLLRNLAEHVAAALHRVQLLESLREIEYAGSRIFELDNVTQEFLRETCGVGFEFAALQLIDRATKTIETVQGINFARHWTGLAKHRLDGETRDIQADIAHTLNVEVISGWNPRFDQWIFDQFDHQRLVRVFLPVFLLRTAHGELIAPDEELYDWDEPEEVQSKDGCLMQFKPAASLLSTPRHNIEVLGTIEAGYTIARQSWIKVNEVRKLFRLVCAKTHTLWETQLNNVLEVIVKNAIRIIPAESASIRLLHDREQDCHAFLAGAGKIGPEFLTAVRPRKGGVSEQAVRDREPKIVDRDFEKHYPELYELTELKAKYPQRYAPGEGIRALASFPLIVSADQYGMLNLHFWREHPISKDELEWGKLFADQALTALQNTIIFQQRRQAERALDGLHSVGQFLVAEPQVKVNELLQRVAQSAINVLNADVVIIYLYDQQRDDFPLLPPVVKGRLIQAPPRAGRIDKDDTPSRIIREMRENIYAPDSADDLILCDRARPRPKGYKEIPFVDREKIESSAGILFRVGSEIVGIMFVNYRTRHTFTPEERRLIETFASAAAVGIHNSRLFSTTDQELRDRLEELTARVTELRHLQEVSTAITYSSTDVKGVLKQIVKGARSVLKADVALLWPYDAWTKTFDTSLVEYEGMAGGLDFDYAPSASGVTAAVLDSPEGYLVVDDVEVPPEKVNLRPSEGFMGKIKVRSFLGVLLRVGSGLVSQKSGGTETVGVLYVDFLRQHTFKKEEVQIAQMFANYAATAIAVARAHERKLEVERLGAINSFGARFAHRVGNLLGTVPLNFAAIQKMLRNTEDPALQSHLESLQEDVHKVQRILDMGRNLRRFGTNKKETVDLNEILREVWAEQSLPANVSATLDLDATVLPLQGNRSLFKDIFVDMVENSLDAMPNGGRLEISTRIQHEHRLVEVRVTDTGHGIPPQVLERLRHEPFTTTKEANMGLGVWLCHQAMQQMGGKLEIESQLNAGTSFIIQLPV